MSNNIKEKTFSNLVWRFAERTGAQGVSFVVSIVLARILVPEIYGTVALITVFTTILQVFVDSGLGTALIQKRNADDLDFSTVFFFNFVVCIVLYVCMFVVAPIIEEFYGIDGLTSLVRVLSLILIISGLKNIQQAYVSRQLIFKRFFFATIGGTLFSAVLGIILAYLGFGAWALVAQQLSNAAIDTLVLWVTVKWRPKLMFSFQRLKELYSFGWKILASAVIDTVYNNIRQLIIGKVYTATDLAYYNRGKQFPSIIVVNINTSIDSVLLPTMASVQDEPTRVKAMTRRAIKTSTYIMAPLMVGMAFCAVPIVRLVLTDKWLPCVPFLRIFCITHMFFPIHTANLNAIKAMGRSDLFLKLEVIKKVMGVVVLVSTMWNGVLFMAYSMLIVSILSQVVNAWPNKKLLNYGYLEQLRDILPGILLAVLMGICTFPVSFMDLPEYLTLAIQIIVGAIIYIVGSRFFKLDSFEYIFEIVKSFLLKTK